jgi:hypothetical protein
MVRTKAELANLAKGRKVRKAQLAKRKKVRIYDRVIDVLVQVTIRTTKDDIQDRPGGGMRLTDDLQRALDAGALQSALKVASRVGATVQEAYVVGEESGSRRDP